MQRVSSSEHRLIVIGDDGYIVRTLAKDLGSSVKTHSVPLPVEHHFENGIGFESSFEDVMSAFGKSIKATDYNLTFANENGYIIKFHFVADTSFFGKRKLIAIEINHPDSGV